MLMGHPAPVSNTLRSSAESKRENTLAQSVSVPPRKYDGAESLTAEVLPEKIHSGTFVSKKENS